MRLPLFRALTASLFLACAAAVICLAAPPLEEISFEGAGRVVKGVRYPAKGPPVLWLHGIFENTRVWKEMGEALHAQGYDVWMINWSGHGKGDQKSTVLSPETGDYSFESLVTKDLPLSVERIFQITGQKISIMGHSFGGDWLLRNMPLVLFALIHTILRARSWVVR
ncbi:alpha/beta fold hydrolase [Bdellovibrionota bacterium FG-2]